MEGESRHHHITSDELTDPDKEAYTTRSIEKRGVYLNSWPEIKLGIVSEEF